MSFFEISKAIQTSVTIVSRKLFSPRLISTLGTYYQNNLQNRSSKIYFDMFTLTYRKYVLFIFDSMARALLIKSSKPILLRLVHAKHLIHYFKVALNPLNLLIYKSFLKSFIYQNDKFSDFFLQLNVIEQTTLQTSMMEIVNGF